MDREHTWTGGMWPACRWEKVIKFARPLATRALIGAHERPASSTFVSPEFGVMQIYRPR